jgi:hypothetical protein
VDSVIIPAHAQTSAPTEPIPLEDNFPPGYPRVTEDSGVTLGTTCSTWAGKFVAIPDLLEYDFAFKYCGGTNWYIDVSVKVKIFGGPAGGWDFTLSASHPKLCPVDLNLLAAQTKLCVGAQIGGGKACINISGDGWVWAGGWHGGNFDQTLVCFTEIP